MLLSALLRRYVEGDHVGFQVRLPHTMHQLLPEASVTVEQLPAFFPSDSTTLCPKVLPQPFLG